MTFYLKEGDILWPTPENALDIREKLPVGTYAVGAHPMKGFYLRPITDFDISGKIYGKTTNHAQRILNTFMSRPNTTGVLLNGEKGSGKTMLAKLISQIAGQQGISTLVINSPYHGDVFNTFIQSIDEPCIIVFDEFEKVFDEKQQEAILTLLDGVFPTKKLFILTANDKYKVNMQMRNRPGRIFYMIDYKGLDAQFIEEYCNDNLNNKTHIAQVCRLTLLFDSFNFDMLKALVEEMNRYDESPKQAMEMLNAKPYDAGRTKHFIECVYQGKKVAAGQIYPSAINGNPIAQEEIEIQLEIPTGEKDSDGDDETDSVYLEVTPQHLKKIDMEMGQFTYVVNEGTPEMAVLVFTRESYKAPAYGSYLDLLS
jgi:hypothetical protein